MQMSRFTKKFTSGVLLFTVVACSSTTNIRSSDPAAKIYIDGELAGTGSAVHTDTKIVGSTTSYRMEKQGCQPLTGSFSRNEKLDVGALIGGLFVLVPFFWIMEYKPERTIEYSCNK